MTIEKKRCEKVCSLTENMYFCNRNIKNNNKKMKKNASTAWWWRCSRFNKS